MLLSSPVNSFEKSTTHCKSKHDVLLRSDGGIFDNHYNANLLLSVPVKNLKKRSMSGKDKDQSTMSPYYLIMTHGIKMVLTVKVL